MTRTAVAHQKQPSIELSKQGRHFGNKRGYWSEKLAEYSFVIATILSSIIILVIFLFVFQKSLPVLQNSGLSFITSIGWDDDFTQAWTSGNFSPVWKFGALPVIAGTIFTTLGSLLIAIPLGLGCAIFLTELAPPWLKGPLESTVRLLAAVPSVIYGLIGLLVIVPFIRNNFVTDALALTYIKEFAMDGTSLLVGTVVLAIMIMPIFIALTADALRAVPNSFKEGALALGVTPWRVIVRVMLPVARPGIIAGAILAAGRAIGEAIALSMVSGSVSYLPDIKHGLVFLLEPVRTMASTIVDNGEGMSVASTESALFTLGILLLLSSIGLSISARLVSITVSKGGSSNG